MKMNLKTANRIARDSCYRWQKNRWWRRINRYRYRKMAEKYWCSKEHQEVMARYKGGVKDTNTYPWPYSDEGFADWTEIDGMIVSDQSGYTVRHSTSYCAWKIFEATGNWPKKRSVRCYSSRRWQKFLAKIGYTEVVPAEELDPEHHCYVGIRRDEHDWSLVVWAEQKVEDGEIAVSSYVDGEYEFWEIDPDKYTWVKIA